MSLLIIITYYLPWFDVCRVWCVCPVFCCSTSEEVFHYFAQIFSCIYNAKFACNCVRCLWVCMCMCVRFCFAHFTQNVWFSYEFHMHILRRECFSFNTDPTNNSVLWNIPSIFTNHNVEIQISFYLSILIWKNKHEILGNCSSIN